MILSSRMMVFVDGENLVMRYQDMLAKGFVPKPNVVHEQDVIAWHVDVIQERLVDIVRATYYTYAVGDEEYLNAVCNRIKQIQYHYRGDQLGRAGNLYPKVFKKPKKSAKRKGVDINITVDVLTHTFKDSVDIIYLVTGDGDYLPLIEEVARNGKQVYLAALSEGLNEKLPYVVDQFYSLDAAFFVLP
jgi:uncharacterized LabA/DUF88 family protein